MVRDICGIQACCSTTRPSGCCVVPHQSLVALSVEDDPICAAQSSVNLLHLTVVFVVLRPLRTLAQCTARAVVLMGTQPRIGSTHIPMNSHVDRLVGTLMSILSYVGAAPRAMSIASFRPALLTVKPAAPQLNSLRLLQPLQCSDGSAHLCVRDRNA